MRVIKHLPGREAQSGCSHAGASCQLHASRAASPAPSRHPPIVHIWLWHNRPGPTETHQPWCQPSGDHAWWGQCELTASPMQNFLTTSNMKPQLAPALTGLKCSIYYSGEQQGPKAALRSLQWSKRVRDRRGWRKTMLRRCDLGDLQENTAAA